MTGSPLLSPLEVYRQGLKAPEALTAEERLVYLLLELETYADMEGWDHFFTTPLMRYYDELRSGLQAIGDPDSVGVLDHYAAFLSSHGVAMEPGAIEQFCCDQGTEAHDWREDYGRHAETRWRRVREWLGQRGIELAD